MSAEDLCDRVLELKTAEDLLRPVDEETVSGELHVYPDLSDHHDERKDPVQFSSGALTESEEDRLKLLKRVFSGFDAYSAEAKGVVHASFTEAALRNYSSHSPLLSKTASAPPTLVEQVRAVTGRR